MIYANFFAKKFYVIKHIFCNSLIYNKLRKKRKKKLKKMRLGIAYMKKKQYLCTEFEK